MATLLIVEDDSNQRLLYEKELTAEGYSVLTASTGLEALPLVQRGNVDLVVLDIRMPGMDGIELLGRILAIDRKIPVIINTAYASYRENFMTWTADAYIVKSSNLTTLKNAVRDVLSRRMEFGATRRNPN